MIVIFNIKFCNGNFVLKLFLCIFADGNRHRGAILKFQQDLIITHNTILTKQ